MGKTQDMAEPLTRSCERCGKQVEAREGSGRYKRYCSDACKQADYRKRSKRNALRNSLKLPVLSLFPGIGLLDRAFEEIGFAVVRGPDLLWGDDITDFHPQPSCYAGIIGGPPCQAFRVLRFHWFKIQNQLTLRNRHRG